METLKIIAGSILAACVYGILHDQITARVCVEYFTIGHPPVFGTDSPTLLGLGWGIIATWWVGAILGTMLALCARLGGGLPKIPARALARPIGIMLAVAGGCAILAGFTGYYLAAQGGVILLEPLATRIAADRHVLFIADLWAHSASYGVGFIGGMTLCALTIRQRLRMARAHKEITPTPAELADAPSV